jgi:hypothetical protein
MYRQTYGSGGSGGGIGGLVGTGLMFLFLCTLPWSLWAVPAAALVFFAVNSTFRRRFLQSFAHKNPPPKIADFRRVLTLAFTFLAALTSFVCLVTAGSEELGWWMIPLAFWGAVFRLRNVACRSEQRIRRSLWGNLFELSLIAAGVLAVFCLGLWYLASMPLNDVTLGSLRHLEEMVKEKHEFLETYAKGWAIAALVLAFFLRMLSDRRLALKPVAAKLTPLLPPSIKWGQRAVTATAISASITFLATEKGPVERIGIQLRDSSQRYEEFRSKVSEEVDRSLRDALVEKAWAERPPELKKLMRESGQFYEERREFETKYKAALDDLGPLLPRVREPFPPSGDLPARVSKPTAQSESAPDSSWTPWELQRTSEEASALEEQHAKKPFVPDSDQLDETAKEALDALSPAESLYTHTFVGALSRQYLVFGEVVEAISSSFVEHAFNALRDSITERVIKARKAHPNQPLSEIIAANVAFATRDIHIDLSRFNATWGERTHAKLAVYHAALHPAMALLDRMVEQAARERFTSEVRSARALQSDLARIAAAKGDDDLRRRVEVIRSAIDDLVEIQKSWSKDTAHDEYWKRRLDDLRVQVRKDLENHPDPRPEVAAVPPMTSLSGGLPSAIMLNQHLMQTKSAAELFAMMSRRTELFGIHHWGNPHGGLRFAMAYCDDQIQALIERESNGPHAPLLVKALGASDYGARVKRWQEKQQEAKAAEVRRELEAKARAEEYVQREMRRMSESRRYEPRVEIP